MTINKKNNNGKLKITWQIVVVVIALFSLMFALISPSLSKPNSSKLAEQLELRVVRVETCMENVQKAIERIELKLDKAIERKKNGN